MKRIYLLFLFVLSFVFLFSLVLAGPIIPPAEGYGDIDCTYGLRGADCKPNVPFSDLDYKMQIFGNVTWPIPTREDFTWVGIATPEATQPGATEDWQTTRYTDGAWAVHQIPADHPKANWTMFTSHEHQSGRVAWFEPIPEILSQDPESPTILAYRSDFFDPFNPKYEEVVYSDGRSWDEGLILEGDNIFLSSRKFYSVDGGNRPSQFLGNESYYARGYNSNVVFGNVALLLPPRWAEALNATVMFGGGYTNARAVGSDGPSVFVSDFDFNNPPEDNGEIPVTDLVFYPYTNASPPEWDKASFTGGGAIVGDYLFISAEFPVGVVKYESVGPSLIPDPTGNYTYEGVTYRVANSPRELNTIEIYPAGTRHASGSRVNSSGSWDFNNPTAYNENFTLLRDVVVSGSEVWRPDGTRVPQGTFFPGGTVFGPGWRFREDVYSLHAGYDSALGRYRMVTVYNLKDLVRVKNGELRPWEVPLVQMWFDDPVWDINAYMYSPLSMDVDQYGRIVFGDRWKDGRRNLLSFFEPADWIRNNEVPLSRPLVPVWKDNDEAQITGNWVNSTGSPVFVGENYLHDGNEGKGTKEARYEFENINGEATVYVRWPGGDSRTFRAKYLIDHSSGRSEVLLNQRDDGAIWKSIGTFDFDGTAAVTISNDEAINGYVIADAVAVIPTSIPQCSEISGTICGSQDSCSSGFALANDTNFCCQGICIGPFECFDGDGDGHNRSSQGSCGPVDCDDSNPNLYNSLQGYADMDGDGYTEGDVKSVCSGASLPEGYLISQNGVDCLDSNPSVNPGATEICSDGLDNDCDGNGDCLDGSCMDFPICNLENSCREQTDLVSHWSFDGNSEDTLHIYNGLLNGGIAQGLGKMGNAYEFDGTNDYINLGSEALSGRGLFSLAFWVRFGDLTRDQAILSKGDWGSNEPLLVWRDELVYGTNIADTLNVLLGNGNSDVRVTAPAGSLNDTEWHHIVLTYEAASEDGLKMYLDGILVDSSSTLDSGSVLDRNSLIIGSTTDHDPTQYLKGSVDELSYWERNLTLEEVQSLYNSGTGLATCLLSQAQSCDGDCSDSDVNQDGKISLTDLILVAQAFGDKDCSLSNEFCSRRDVNQNGSVNILDLILVAVGTLFS